MALYGFVFIFIAVHILNIFKEDITNNGRQYYKYKEFYEKHSHFIESYDPLKKEKTAKIIDINKNTKTGSIGLEPPLRECFLTEYEWLNHLNAFMLERNNTLKEDVYLFKRFKTAC